MRFYLCRTLNSLPVGIGDGGGGTTTTAFVMNTVAVEGVPTAYCISGVIDISNTSTPSSTESVVADNVICPVGFAIIAGELVTRV